MTVRCYIKTMTKPIYSVDQLSDMAGFTIRTIRYYIQEGLLDPPAGRGRGGYYYDSHLQRLLEIKALQDRGLKLAAIQEVLKRGEAPPPAAEREIWVRFPVIPGLEIHISREVEVKEQKKIREIVKIAKSILEEEESND